jgi:hypothetical protein
MKTKLFAGAVAAGAALGVIGMTGTASAQGGPIAATIPAAPITAPIIVAHCNVIAYDGWSPCFNPGGVMIPNSTSKAS